MPSTRTRTRPTGLKLLKAAASLALAAIVALVAFVTTASAAGSYTIIVGNLTVVVANAVITITGTAGPDVIHVTQDARGNVYLNGVLIGINPALIQVSAMQGADYIQMDVNFPTYLRGGPGNDTIISGFSTNTVYGDLDNDQIILRSWADTAWGGPGADTFTLGPYYVQPAPIPGGGVYHTYYFSIIEDFSKAEGDMRGDPSNPAWSLPNSR